MKKKLLGLSVAATLGIIATTIINLNLSNQNDKISLVLENVEALATPEDGNIFQCYSHCQYTIDRNCVVYVMATQEYFQCRLQREL